MAVLLPILYVGVFILFALMAYLICCITVEDEE
jgi:hypothetical protein